jgi:hypothetical protein
VSTNGFNFSGFLPAFSWLNFGEPIHRNGQSLLPEDPELLFMATVFQWILLICQPGFMRHQSAQFLCVPVTFQIDRRLALFPLT